MKEGFKNKDDSFITSNGITVKIIKPYWKNDYGSDMFTIQASKWNKKEIKDIYDKTPEELKDSFLNPEKADIENKKINKAQAAKYAEVERANKAFRKMEEKKTMEAQKKYNDIDWFWDDLSNIKKAKLIKTLSTKKDWVREDFKNWYKWVVKNEETIEYNRRKFNRLDEQWQKLYEKQIENSRKDVYYIEKKTWTNTVSSRKVLKTEYDYIQHLEKKAGWSSKKGPVKKLKKQ